MQLKSEQLPLDGVSVSEYFSVPSRLKSGLNGLETRKRFVTISGFSG
jgi:hypothetical protein